MGCNKPATVDSWTTDGFRSALLAQKSDLYTVQCTILQVAPSVYCRTECNRFTAIVLGEFFSIIHPVAFFLIHKGRSERSRMHTQAHGVTFNVSFS